MEFIELVKKRQSVRSYISKPVPRHIIEKCIESARLAPSACNSQPWKFIVIDDLSLKNKIYSKACSGIYRVTARFVDEAPVLIVVIREKSNYAAKVGSFFRNIQYSLIDSGIACENLILQAAECGVGTCLIGWFNEKAIKDVLMIPEDLDVDLIISMGYPKEDKIRKKTRKTLSQVLSYNKFI